ncbi:MAG: V-type ATP synthase subunit E [Patescibacteria group bacterium]|nr:V-type ATP synthase subunit E [Patescibacteria group bacterium]
MALENILEKIKKEAREEIKKIEQESEQKIEEIKADFKEKEEKEKERIISESKKQAEKKIQQAKFILANQKKSKLLREKQMLLDEVFTLAAKKMDELDQEKQISLLQKLIKNLPSQNKAEIQATENSKDLVKKALEKSDKSITLSSEKVKGQGGFIFSSEKLEIDNRYSTLVQGLRDEVETQVAKILFS